MEEKIANWFKWGFWSAEMVQDAVTSKLLTQTQADNIINGETAD